MRRFAATGLLVSLALAMTPASAAPEPYEINVILAMTGLAGFIGQQEAQSLHALETTVNATGGIRGTPIHFVISDDQSNPANAVPLETAILAKGVAVILGPTLTGSDAAVAPLVKNLVVQYFFSPSMKPAAGSTTFSSFISTNDLSRAAIRYFRERGWKRLALISSTDASGQDGYNVVMENLQLPENKGITLVANERFGIGDVSVAAQMSRIKAANAQALIAWTTGTPFGTVLHAVSDLGLDLPVMSSPANLIRAQVLQYASFLPPQVYFVGGRLGSHDVVRPGPLRDAQNVFFHALTAEKVAPESTHVFSWDPALIVIDALKHLGTGATAAQIHDYIEHLHGFAGVNGLYDFRDGSQRGLGLSSAVIVRWDPAKSTFVAASSGGGAPLGGH